MTDFRREALRIAMPWLATAVLLVIWELACIVFDVPEKQSPVVAGNRLVTLRARRSQKGRCLSRLTQFTQDAPEPDARLRVRGICVQRSPIEALGALEVPLLVLDSHLTAGRLDSLNDALNSRRGKDFVKATG